MDSELGVGEAILDGLIKCEPWPIVSGTAKDLTQHGWSPDQNLAQLQNKSLYLEFL